MDGKMGRKPSNPTSQGAAARAGIGSSWTSDGSSPEVACLIPPANAQPASKPQPVPQPKKPAPTAEDEENVRIANEGAKRLPILTSTRAKGVVLKPFSGSLGGLLVGELWLGLRWSTVARLVPCPASARLLLHMLSLPLASPVPVLSLAPS